MEADDEGEQDPGSIRFLSRGLTLRFWDSVDTIARYLSRVLVKVRFPVWSWAAALLCLAGTGLVCRDTLAVAGSGPANSGATASVERAANQDRPRLGFRAPDNLEEWATALIACTNPGNRVREYAGAFQGSPLQKIVQLYSRVHADWVYRPDPPGNTDWFISAEDVLAPGKFAGDCEDVAAFFVSVLRVWDYSCRLVATERSGTHPAHVFAQVLVAGPGEDASALMARLGREWSHTAQGSPGAARITPAWESGAPVETDRDGTWLSLDGGTVPTAVADLGPRELLIYPDGRTVDLNHKPR